MLVFRQKLGLALQTTPRYHRGIASLLCVFRHSWINTTSWEKATSLGNVIGLTTAF